MADWMRTADRINGEYDVSDGKIKIEIEFNSVKDGLPDEDMTVLMAVRYAVGHQKPRYYSEVVPGFLIEGHWRYLDGFHVAERDRVTHWAEMPEFPDESVREAEVIL